MTLGAHFLDDLQRRELACRLARYGVGGARGRSVGDPVHEEVTEGRRRQYEIALQAGQEWARRMQSAGGGYHSCGDLAHWMLYRLGCRDERLVNRTADEGAADWMPVRNITNITGSSAYRKARNGDVPKPGDILFLMDRGGHLAVLLDWDAERGEVDTADYGQPYGCVRIRTLAPSGGGWLLGGRPLDGWLDLDRVEWSAAPTLPEGLLRRRAGC